MLDHVLYHHQGAVHANRRLRCRCRLLLLLLLLRGCSGWLRRLLRGRGGFSGCQHGPGPPPQWPRLRPGGMLHEQLLLLLQKGI